MVTRPRAAESRTQQGTEVEVDVQERRLRLVGSPEPETRPPRHVARVSWTEDTVDNEHLNRKKSKICCIFHPNREFGESSEEEDDVPSDSSSSSDSDSDSDAGSDSSPCCGHHHRHTRRSRPNAYERLPKLKR